MSGLQQNLLAALNGGFQFGQNVKAAQDRNQLAHLSSQAYGAAPEQRQQLYSQMAAINPQAAQQQEQAFASADEKRNQSLSNAARLLMSAPEQYRPGIYQQMRSGLSNFIPNLPEQYDQSVAQAAQSIAQAYAGPGNQTPTDVRSFQMMTAGLSPEDRERARRVNLGLDGRASSSGFSQVKVTGADGRERVGVLNGRTGQIDLPDGTSFNPQTGAITPTQGGNVLPQGGGQQVLDQDAALANQMIAAGIPEAQVDAFLAQRAASFGGGGVAQQPAMAPTGNPNAFVGRTPEEQAAAIEAAKFKAQNENFPNQLNQEQQLQDIRTQASIDQAAGQDQYKRQVEASSALPQVKAAAGQMLSVISKLKTHPGLRAATGLGSVNPLNSVPGTQGFNFRVLADQLGGQTFLQAFETLKGGGPITDIEGKKATDAIARLNLGQSAEEYVQALTDLEDVAKAVQQRAEERAMRQPAQRAPAARQPQSPSGTDFSNLWN